ncbi:MAG TPA: lysophospholipid acyltransferase family protein [Thermomicrobiales bacterium]|nr:lysophospholipid acyltransferase family protein [Thermomicrobiales bacterium]
MKPWQYWGFRLALALAARLPRGLGYRLGALGGELYFWANPGHSGKAVDNLAVMLADDPGAPRVRETARRVFRNYGKYLFDFFRLSSLDPDALEEDVVIDGLEHLDAALAAGRGAIMVTGHFGLWDLAGTILAARGYPASALVDTFAPPALDELVQRTRHRFGLGLVPVEQPGSLRGVQRLLRRNQIAVVVLDRPQREGGVLVEFFGAPAWLPTGAARFALRTGAPVVLGYLLRRPGDRTYYGVVEPPVAFAPSGDAEADVAALTQAIVHRLERLLRAYPDQWYMFRRMWPDLPRDATGRPRRRRLMAER